MQDYFHQHLFADNPSALVDLSFVGTLAIIFVNGCSPIVQVCVARFGLRSVMIVGACFQVIALELSSLSTQVNIQLSDTELCMMTSNMLAMHRFGICISLRVSCTV